MKGESEGSPPSTRQGVIPLDPCLVRPRCGRTTKDFSLDQHAIAIVDGFVWVQRVQAVAVVRANANHVSAHRAIERSSGDAKIDCTRLVSTHHGRRQTHFVGARTISVCGSRHRCQHRLVPSTAHTGSSVRITVAWPEAAARCTRRTSTIPIPTALTFTHPRDVLA